MDTYIYILYERVGVTIKENILTICRSCFHSADVELRDYMVRFYHEHGQKMQSLNWLIGNGSVLEKTKDES